MTVFGPTPGEDGVVGETAETAHSGVVGQNEATAPSAKSIVEGAGVVGRTAVPGGSGVAGVATHPTQGIGVQGNGSLTGVVGVSQRGIGMKAESDRHHGLVAITHSGDRNGVLGENDATDQAEGTFTGNGVAGVSSVPNGAGVFGASTAEAGAGIEGVGAAVGVRGSSDQGVGVGGYGHTIGVAGASEFGLGLQATSTYGDGTSSVSKDANRNGIVGINEATTAPNLRRYAGDVARLRPDREQGADQRGLADHMDRNARATRGVGDIETERYGRGVPARTGGDYTRTPVEDAEPAGNGVYGYTHVPGGSGVFGAVSVDNTKGAGVTGVGPIAGMFRGNVIVTGDIQLGAADYAEDFNVADGAEAHPGAVMVLAGQGDALTQSDVAYDSRVAGVVCGAGTARPGIILDRQSDLHGRVPIAMMGKVYCQADDSGGAIQVGDLLTTSSRRGHAMRVADRSRAVGAILGKALQDLPAGTGLIPILVTLQ